MPIKSLKVWTGHDSPQNPLRPRRDQVLYEPPNPNQTRKRCDNCVLWLAPAEQCFIHDEALTITADMICGYHLFGEPGAALPRREGMPALDPTLTGLEQIRGGTSCDTCVHYSPDPAAMQGVCEVVYERELDDTGEPIQALVQALGCCTLWEQKP